MRRSNCGWWPICVAVACMAVSVFAAGMSAAELVGVTPLVRDGTVLVSFELANALTGEIRAAIRSGLPTVFSYDVELRRAAPVWFDRTIASSTVSASVRYDNLTSRYQVSRMQDGHVEDSQVTDQEEVVRRMLTAFERLPLFSTTQLEPNVEYYVRVRARTRPRNAWFFLPWDRDAASAVAKFTFIP